MKAECSVICDLLPLYATDRVSPETAEFVKAHLEDCAACRAELACLGSGKNLSEIEKNPDEMASESKPFKKFFKRFKTQFRYFSYAALIFLIFLGFSATCGEDLMYNTLIMPAVGVIGYYVFREKSIFKVPLLLLTIDTLLWLLDYVDLDFYSVLLWTVIYTFFVGIGIAIGFFLHFAFRKENG